MLNNAAVYPTKAILASVLGNCNETYQALMRKLPEYLTELEWRYYNDGKAWLGKAVTKKKTVFWLSIWQGFFRVSFHFTEKTRVGIQDLPVSDEIKKRMESAPVKGKLVSLIIDVSNPGDLKDILTLIFYKQNCK
jgi:hypothetical protein